MIKVKLNELSNHNLSQREIADRAVEILKRVLNSPEFAERVRKNRYTTLWRINDLDGYEQTTADELLDIILTGRELYTDPDFEIDLTVCLDRMKKGILGATPIGGTRYHDSLLVHQRLYRVRRPGSLSGALDA